MSVSQKPLRVLVADDVQANRTLLRAYLGRLGFEAITAENGEEAVQMFQSNRPDIVLMDLMMPVMDGFDAIRHIRNLDSRRWVPIFVVSAMDTDADIIRALEGGADDYLVKPLSYQVFAAKMRNMSRALSFQRAQDEAHRRESAISDAVIDGIITFDGTGAVITLNRAAAQIFGVHDDALVGRHLATLVTERERPAFALELARNLEHGTGQLIGRVAEISACTLGGRNFPMELTISALPSDRKLFIGVVRDISERKRAEQQIADDAARLRQYHEEVEAEAELAKDILDRHIHQQHTDKRGAQLMVLPTERFSGDIVLAGRSPSGLLYGLLADATGHGLAAAMSGLSVVSQFHQSVRANASVSQIVAETNKGLRALLPPGRFVAAAIICIDETQRRASYWIGGVPSVLHFGPDGQLQGRLPSAHLALGITDLDESDCEPAYLSWDEPGGCVLLCSDGVFEAALEGGNEFGEEGAIEVMRRNGGSAGALSALNAALAHHMAGHNPHDDASALLLQLD
ncbi:SpoIIE family protein phosphatase [Viridibacterium curvum]|uniref:PAS domain S-box protein n=1 Tax=Viridibacterium curvum TaxID=1101404 RepID=A0ABP9QZ27_9RHOO